MKPRDFLLGVLDLFAALLPGSLATWLVTQYLQLGVLRGDLCFGLGNGTRDSDSVVLGIAFLLSSNVFGHFVFMAGAQPDVAYHRWRTRAKLAEADKTFLATRTIQQKLTQEIVGSEFTRLKREECSFRSKPTARAEIDRLQADSKFLRSLVVVSVALAVHFLLCQRSPAVGVLALGMAVLAYHRLPQQRWRMTELSYATAVTVDAASVTR